MTKTILACVGSSLLTVGILTVLGAGPLTPPTGPVSPTNVTLDQLAAAIAAVQPGGVTIPGPSYVSGGTATFSMPAVPGSSAAYTVTVPLIGYSATKGMPRLSPTTYPFGTNYTASNIPVQGTSVFTIAFQAGAAGAKMASPGSMQQATVTINGSDGTTIGPFLAADVSRQVVNGPTASGNKAVHVISYTTYDNVSPIQDQSGSGQF